MRLKTLSRADLTDLKMCSAALSNLPGTGSATASDDPMFLGIHGNGFIMVDIESEMANLIWEMGELPKDCQKSAYNEMIESESLKLYCAVYKAGTFFSTYYFANAAIMFGDNKQVKFGSVAAKRISELVEKIRKHMMGQEPMPDSTEEAISLMC